MNSPTKNKWKENVIPILKTIGLLLLGVLFLAHSYNKYFHITSLEHQGEEVRLGWFYGFIYKYLGVYGVSGFFIIVGLFTIHKAYLAFKTIRIK
ncbi:MAG: hypothetical protein Q3992_05810 [Bacteroides sp.]|nr:hypothetical protein [Bacteroides sp.]